MPPIKYTALYCRYLFCFGFGITRLNRAYIVIGEIMEENKIVKTHNLKYENEKKITLSGIKNVESFSERQVFMTLSNGKTLTLDGIGLGVVNLDVDGGNLEIDGEITKLVYSGKKTPKSFFKKLFK